MFGRSCFLLLYTAHFPTASTGQTLAQMPQFLHFSMLMLNFPSLLIITAPKGHYTSQVPQLIHLERSI